MKLTTEHNVNDEVWVIYNGKLEKGKVKMVGVYGEFTSQEDIKFIYYIIPTEKEDWFRTHRPASFYPNRVFKSKEKALEVLSKEV